MWREYGGALGLVVIDYLQLMSAADSGVENRATEISEISRSLKAMSKELQVPVIALSQLNRGLEQRPNKRPVMSDLRECVTGDTLVTLRDGRRVPVRELVGTTPEVWAVDDAGKVIPAQSDAVWHVGRKPVFNVQLASGRSIRATAEHLLLAGKGWTRLGRAEGGRPRSRSRGAFRSRKRAWSGATSEVDPARSPRGRWQLPASSAAALHDRQSEENSEAVRRGGLVARQHRDAPCRSRRAGTSS